MRNDFPAGECSGSLGRLGRNAQNSARQQNRPFRKALERCLIDSLVMYSCTPKNCHCLLGVRYRGFGVTLPLYGISFGVAHWSRGGRSGERCLGPTGGFSHGCPYYSSSGRLVFY